MVYLTTVMTAPAIRILIREKLKDGCLPYDSMPRFWGRPASEEICDACDLRIEKTQLVMEGIASKISDKKPVQSSYAATREAAIDAEALRRLIRGKLQNGRLPHEGVKRIWSSPSDGETCNACDTVLAKDQVLMEGVTLDLGRSHMLQLHVRCFQMWEHERRAA